MTTTFEVGGEREGERSGPAGVSCGVSAAITGLNRRGFSPRACDGGRAAH